MINSMTALHAKLPYMLHRRSSHVAPKVTFLGHQKAHGTATDVADSVCGSLQRVQVRSLAKTHTQDHRLW